MTTECAEVALTLRPPLFTSFDEAARYVRSQLPDESTTVIDNIAEMLWRTPTCAIES